jgi:C4-dicarboxylate-specific signal transduction histidine kinase
MPVAVLALIQALVAFAPDIPEIAAAVETVKELLTSGSDPTPAQQATIDAALTAANAALQAS